MSIANDKYVVPFPPVGPIARMSGSKLRAALGVIPRRAVFEQAGWLTWCPTLVRTADRTCHLLYSRWPQSQGHDAWLTHSEVAYATADDPLGPYTVRGVVLAGAGGDAWDANVTHNPTLLEHEGKYYLYYTGNYGNGQYWDHRNHQRIGVAVADHPAGPWRRMDRPTLDVSPGSWDSLMVSNPTVTRCPDGRFCMVYKGVGNGPMPKGGAVVCGVAFADHPLGPFIKQPEPIITNPEHDWAVEDPFIWCQDGRYYCIVKDFQGYFARSERNVLVLFESRDGVCWVPALDPLVLRRELHWADGAVDKVAALERPQLWIENGQPRGLLLACAPDESRDRSFIVHIPLVADAQ